MPKPPISVEVLRTSFELLDNMKRQIKLAEEMKRALLARAASMEELICANYKHDKQAFHVLADAHKKASWGSTQRFYYDSVKTKLAVQNAKQWLEMQNEKDTV